MAADGHISEQMLILGAGFKGFAPGGRADQVTDVLNSEVIDMNSCF